RGGAVGIFLAGLRGSPERGSSTILGFAGAGDPPAAAGSHVHFLPGDLRAYLRPAGALSQAMEIPPTVPRLRDAEDQTAGRDAVGGTASVAPGRGAVAGQTVGPYVLLCRLGVGGMGEVWLARRAEGGLQREVALKLPLTNPLPWDIAQRFSLERDI